MGKSEDLENQARVNRAVFFELTEKVNLLNKRAEALERSGDRLRARIARGLAAEIEAAAEQYRRP
jgi:chaperonin cofactor prefoldin